MRSTVLLQCFLLVWTIPARASDVNAISNSNTAAASASAAISSAASTSAIDSSAASTTDSSAPSSAAPSSTVTDSAAASTTASSFTSSITSSLTTSTISTSASSSSPSTMSTTTSTTPSASATSSSTPFKWDAGEIAATAVLLSFISIGAVSIIIWWIRRARRNRRAPAADRGVYEQPKGDAAGMAERGPQPESHPMIQFGAMPERDSPPSSHESIYRHQSTAYTGGLEQYPERQPTLSSTHSTVPCSPYSAVSPLERSPRSPSPVMSQWQQRPGSTPGRGLHREFSFESQDQSFIPAALTPGGRRMSFAS